MLKINKCPKYILFFYSKKIISFKTRNLFNQIFSYSILYHIFHVKNRVINANSKLKLQFA